jgi:hypothetical protein
MQSVGYFCPTLTAREFGLRIWVKFRPVGPEFFHVETDGMTDRQTERSKLIVAFRTSFANARKKTKQNIRIVKCNGCVSVSPCLENAPKYPFLLTYFNTLLFMIWVS